jgi:hypothetical protein
MKDYGSDGYGDDLAGRVGNMLRISSAPAYAPYVEKRPDPSWGQGYNVKMPKYQKSNRGFKVPSMPNLPVGSIVNIAILAAVGIAGYKLYTMFFGNSVIGAKADNGQAAIDKTYVDSNQAKADLLKGTAASLQSQGLSVSTLHSGLADTFHGWLDSLWVDHGQIVTAILGENVQTFRLVSVAYGTRDLSTYINSVFHVFNAGNWSIANPLSSTKGVGTLKEHLTYVLTADELTKIHDYISAI